MYTVKRLIRTKWHIFEGYAVIDALGGVVKTINPHTGKVEKEIYKRKYTAQKSADYFNRCNDLIQAAALAEELYPEVINELK